VTIHSGSFPRCCSCSWLVTAACVAAAPSWNSGMGLQMLPGLLKEKKTSVLSLMPRLAACGFTHTPERILHSSQHLTSTRPRKHTCIIYTHAPQHCHQGSLPDETKPLSLLMCSPTRYTRPSPVSKAPSRLSKHHNRVCEHVASVAAELLIPSMAMGAGSSSSYSDKFARAPWNKH
jgi:hypothetical protein